MSKALMCALQGGRTRGQDLLAGRGDAESAAAGKGTEVEAVPVLSEYDREGFGLSAYDLFEVPRPVLLPLRAVVESVSKPMFEGLLMSCDISTGFRFGLYAYITGAALVWNGSIGGGLRKRILSLYGVYISSRVQDLITPSGM